MVILSAAILGRTGKVLLARQFAEISRLRIEGFLSAFARLVESSSCETTLETESVRFLYIPLESLNLVLVTTKQSNILEDLDTLKLLQQVLHQVCEASVTEESVLTKAFDIVFAFDEVISFGYREPISLAQVKTFTDMVSHEETLSQLVIQTKINEERKRAQQVAAKLAKERREQQRQTEAAAKLAVAAITSSFSSGNLDSDNQPDIGSPTGGIVPITTTTTTTAAVVGPAGPAKGMQLGRKTQKAVF